MRAIHNIILLLAVVCALTGFSTSRKPEGWKEHKTTYIIVYYHPSISDAAIKDFARRCDRYYHWVAYRLGFSQYDFWHWEDRAKVFLYRTQSKYVGDKRRQGWSGGSTSVKRKEIYTFYQNEEFFDAALPHELTHIVLREFIGTKANVPLWFEEGVASMNERNSFKRHFRLSRELLGKNFYMSVEEMEAVDKTKELLVPDVFYANAASILIFLHEEHGKENFVILCKKLQMGAPFYRSMNEVYGVEDTADLNRKFLRFLRARKAAGEPVKRDYGFSW